MAVDNRDGPTLLVLTRQACAHQAREPAQVADISRGGYVLIDPAGAAEAIVIATGSEVGIAAEAVRTRERQGPQGAPGVDAEHEYLRAQDDAYKESVLPAAVTRRVAVEAGVRAAWWQLRGA